MLLDQIRSDQPPSNISCYRYDGWKFTSYGRLTPVLECM